MKKPSQPKPAPTLFDLDERTTIKTPPPVRDAQGAEWAFVTFPELDAK